MESSKAGTLLSWLVTFKKLHDDNAQLQEVMPDFIRRHAARYAGVGLRDLCAEMHAFYRDRQVSSLQRLQFRRRHFPEMAMKPDEAVRQLVRNNVDYLPIDSIAGRIATTLMLVYPPGIATIIPGERLDERAQPMIDYLLRVRSAPPTGSRASRRRSRASIGRREPDGSIRFYTYVARE